MKTLIAIWRALGLWRWRETRVYRSGFRTAWLSVYVSRATREAQERAPEHTVEIDWGAVPKATHHRILWRVWAILVLVPHDNWLYGWFEAVQGAGSEAMMDLYWDSGQGCTLPPYTDREYRWLQRRVWWRTVTKTALTYPIIGLRCRLFGHDYDTDGVDYPESGGEGFTCTRCGHGFTAWH